MAVPKIAVPHYDTVLPSGKRVSFRPFLVKEEKLLMIAMQSGDAASLLDTAKQILENCVGSVSNISVDKLPLFDVEYLFLQLRARSIGEVVKMKFKCNHPVANGDNETVACGTVSEYEINLLDIKPTFGEGHSKIIQLTDAVGVTMRYPTFTSFKRVSRQDLPPEEAFQVLVECIDSIHDTNNVVYTKDIPTEEVLDFVEGLTHAQINKLDTFFSTMPKISTTIHFKCPKCGDSEDIPVEGIENFFD